jgi:hypothetical protein
MENNGNMTEHADKCPFNVPEKLAGMEAELLLLKDSLSHMRESLHTLVGRSNDIFVKVINGKTETRLASELLGEMYVAVKELKKITRPEAIAEVIDDRISEAPVKQAKKWGEFASGLINIATLATLFYMILKGAVK